MREFKTDIGLVFVIKQEKICVFCEHCTDIWYDANGPYMISCELNKPNADEHNIDGSCEDFQDDYVDEVIE